MYELNHQTIRRTSQVVDLIQRVSVYLKKKIREEKQSK